MADNIQPLLVGLGRVGMDWRRGDTVFFGTRKPPSPEELERRMEAIRKELAGHAATPSGTGGTCPSDQRSGRKDQHGTLPPEAW